MPAIKISNLLHPKASIRLALHLAFWTLLFIVRFYLTLIGFNVYGGLPIGSIMALSLLSTGVIAAFYYVLANVAWKLLLGKKQPLQALLIIVATLLVYTVIDTVAERLVLNACRDCMVTLGKNQPGYYSLVRSGITNIVLKRLLTFGTPFSLVLTLFIPLCLKTTLNAYRRSMDSLKLAKENIQLEFNFLKAQLNPHFLFNTMNNIYGLIISGENERSANLVARLSELFRYILYDSNEDSMSLTKEVKLMNDYIELEKVRLNFIKVVFEVNIDDENYEIAPLLLMPLIENAFKFSTDGPESHINIFLNVINGQLHFSINNNIDRQRIRSASSGIGLKNLEKRLALYYPDKYVYESSVSETTYFVNLTIQLA